MWDGVDTSPQLLYVDPAQLATWSARVRPHFEKMAAGSHGRYLAVDILSSVAARRMHLWLVVREAALMCVTVTEVVEYPRLRAMRLVGLVGSRPRQWMHLIHGIERSAKENFGCDRMEAMHIPRFRTILPGYEMTHWLSEKPL